MNKFKSSIVWSIAAFMLMVGVATAQVSSPGLGKFIFDTLSNLKVNVQSCFSGESICIPTSPNSYMMIHGATIRDIIGMTGVTTNTTSVIFTIPTGAKTPRGKVEGTGAITQTQKLYGTYDTSTTVANSKLLCTITLTGTTKHAKGCDSGAQVTEDWPNYFIVTENTTGTGATGEMIIGTGIMAAGTSAGGAGDASAANQTTMIGHMDGLEGGLGAAADAAATVGSTGSATAKLRLQTTQLDAIQTAVQAIDNDQTGATACVHISTASTNSINCLASAGRAMFGHFINTTSTLAYLRLYNLASAPTCSSATGFVESIPIPHSTGTGAGVSFNYSPTGQAFSTGIGFCITGGGSSTDNTNAVAGVYVKLGNK